VSTYFDETIGYIRRVEEAECVSGGLALKGIAKCVYGIAVTAGNSCDQCYGNKRDLGQVDYEIAELGFKDGVPSSEMFRKDYYY